MKKILLIIFIAISSFIAYQIILGDNGIIENITIQKEKEKLLFYKSLLLKQKEEQANYIKYLKNNPKAYKELAAKLGFTEDEENTQIVKIIDASSDSLVLNENNFKTDEKINKLLAEYQNKNNINQQVSAIRIIVSVIFYIFFGFFLVLVILGGTKND
ncbi:MAG: hypothetical protein A2086_02965 [Spirochaetes bacterium GWD1_27_9]|nr:MAG: hypothetical protein A2Z98_12110 [Spirochaetes bacterium GWB1_27_13]OHD26440.1 MAG: hypothetical protein A2Y34_10045 [Spirochaetes bacterium GWC1_27_15]OHD45128.1 MAG: hypothetical protein A2086_02965 [Spirochaetes bacterium GWD1_27_9]